LSLFRVGVFRNRFLIAAVLISLGMMVAVIEWEPLATMFHTTPLHWQDWLLAAGLGLTILPVVEVAKLIFTWEERSPRRAAKGEVLEELRSASLELSKQSQELQQEVQALEGRLEALKKRYNSLRQEEMELEQKIAGLGSGEPGSAAEGTGKTGKKTGKTH
jgi:uncharacterized protein YlxW (UPF0749 family)